MPFRGLLFVGHDDYEFAWIHRPILKFDAGAYNQETCFPDQATDSNNNVCKKFNPEAPIYYKKIQCGNFLKLVWHFWYGQQTPCTNIEGIDSSSGLTKLANNILTQENDWERITINFVWEDGEWVQDSVTFYQYDGWYTRKTKSNKPNPEVWVGKTSHGSYDTGCDGKSWWKPLSVEFCQGGCGYWDDFRNANSRTEWFPTNIQALSEVSGEEVTR